MTTSLCSASLQQEGIHNIIDTSVTWIVHVMTSKRLKALVFCLSSLRLELLDTECKEFFDIVCALHKYLLERSPIVFTCPWIFISHLKQNLCSEIICRLLYTKQLAVLFNLFSTPAIRYTTKRESFGH